ncbi:hypothetical protein SLEP1_g56372 [Rubroshorea leprosula]|uniref:Uncharacterized protein n=1 Tax=Rubroshorea leprosula TaxID=152421 RepID=A0AAV5MLF6_9ROSI|nr:hypothetical protein SLEP1_g56372 [Rubroshorea leprosula]
MSGFQHRVYKIYDPSAKVTKKLAKEVFSIVGRDPLIEMSNKGAFIRYEAPDLKPNIVTF